MLWAMYLPPSAHYKLLFQSGNAEDIPDRFPNCYFANLMLLSPENTNMLLCATVCLTCAQNC